MADVQSNEANSMETNRAQDTTASKSFCLLRPSAFSSSSTALRDGNGSTENDASASQTASRFQLRPSMLDKHAASLFKDSAASATPSRSSASFKLEPPKLLSPLSSKFTDNNKSVLNVGASDGTDVSSSSSGTQTADSASATHVSANASTNSLPLAAPGTLLKVTPMPSSEAVGFLFGQQMDSRVATTATERPAGATAAAPVITSAAAPTGFVFGSNLADRAVVVATGDSKPATELATGAGDDKADSRLQAETAAATEPATQSLEQSAAIQQAKQSHVELKEVEVITGEENESNVFQLNVKLFVFDKKTQSWLERGIGLLRLNDKLTPTDAGSFQSRLVMRVQGSLRVVLNTMVWPGMLIERCSKKSVKISAVDPEEGIRIYLIQANPSDTDHIFNAISSRALKLKAAEAAKRPPSAGASSSPHKESPGVAVTTDVAMSSTPVSEKRSIDATEDGAVYADKRRRVDPEQRREQQEDESNDSSAVDPETEASNEGFSSSPPIQSSSSEA